MLRIAPGGDDVAGPHIHAPLGGLAIDSHIAPQPGNARRHGALCQREPQLRHPQGQRRSAGGVNINANYTVSRCVGLEMVPNAQFGIGYINPADPDYDRGHCEGDRTHLANGTVGYVTPAVDDPVLGLLASNWRLSGIVNVRSGSWMSVLSGRDGAFNGQANQRVDQVSDEVYGAKTVASYLNRAAFAQPALGTYGTSGRNAYEGPGSRNVDLSLVRSFRFSTHRIEARVEAFNAFNWFSLGGSENIGNPVTALNNANFGRILSAGDPRIMQFAVKYQF
jgi:hypothetical protein